jgi:hypothetical protein
MAPAFGRVAAAIEALDRESEGLGRIAAAPGRLWLDFALRAIVAVVSERRRESEAAADVIEAQVVGPELAASSLLAHVAATYLEGDWPSDVQKLVVDREGDPLASLAERTREALTEITARDVIEWTLGDEGPDHPAVLTRLRVLGHEDVALELLTDPALPHLLTDPDRATQRLWDAMRDDTAGGEALHLNAPRITPGIVGWIIAGIAFAVIFAVRGIGEGESLQIVIVITLAWLTFPVVYPYLQREAVLDTSEFRIRPWWYRWIDRPATRLRWTTLRRTDAMALKLGRESWATLSNGTESTSWWAGIWPKRELGRLIDVLREGGGMVEISEDASIDDPERNAVVWYIRGRFVIPEMRIAADGSLITVKPVKSVGTGAPKLSFALTDRLHDAVPPAGPKDVIAQVRDLAEGAKVDVATFEAEARRAEIHRGRDEWSITIDDIEGAWTAPRKVDELDIADMLIEVLHAPTLEEESEGAQE